MRMFATGRGWNGMVSVPMDAESVVFRKGRFGKTGTARRSGTERRRLSAARPSRLVVAAFLASMVSQVLLRAAPLEEVIREGNTPRLRRLVKDRGVVVARDELGETALHVAAFVGDADSVRLLLEAGADANATNHAGVTPLLRAAADPRKVAVLLQHGARPNLASQLGHTPLHLAARSPQATESVRLLVKQGADVNARSIVGATPLMAAAAASNLEAVRLLVEQGAEVNAVPIPQGKEVDPIFGGLRTPLMWAAFRGDLRVVEYLLDHGADVNLVSGFGTALSQTGWTRRTEVARLLIERGAKVDVPEPFSGFTALHWAASVESRRADMVELLLRHGAQVNAEGGQPVDAFMGVPQTPLSLARQRGDSEVTRALLAAGATDQPTGSKGIGEVHATRVVEAFTASSAREAMAQAMVPLQKTSVDSRRTFLQHASKQGCVSCHQQFLPLAAVGAAEQVNASVDAAQRSELIGTVLQVHRNAEIDWQPLFHPEATHTYGYALLGLDAVGAATRDVSDLMVHHLAAIQHLDGHWDLNLFRPPMQSSDVTATALGVYALSRHSWTARDAEFEAKVRRAATWLTAQEPETHEERVYQLLGLHWAGAPRSQLGTLAKAIAAKQDAQGGWAQHEGRAADAYATGQALYALRVAGAFQARHETCRRAAEFLLSHQLADGTWHVRRRAFPFQPTMDSGFPHGRDGWISATASSWAVMALSTMSEPGGGRRRSREESGDRPIAAVVGTPNGAGAGAGAGAGSGRGEVEGRSTVMVDFARDIRPVLERSCVPCHSGERPRGGYRLTTREAMLAGGQSGAPAVLAGHAGRSPLVDLVNGRVTEMEMPPVSKRAQFPALNAAELELLQRWIDSGAAWPDGVELRR